MAWFLAAYRRSSSVRSAVLAGVVVAGWLLFFWFVNATPTGASAPAPAAPVVSTNDF